MPVTEGFVCWTEPIGTVGPCQYITNRLGCIDIAARAGSITKPADADLAQGNPLGTYDGINAYIYTVCPQVPAIPTTTTTVSPITLTLTASCIGSGINGTGRIVASAFSGGTGTYANIKIGNSLSNAAAATPVVLSGATSYTWNNLVNSTWFVILTDNAGNSNYAQVVVSCTNTTTTTTSTTSTTTAAPICTYNGGSAVVIYPITSTTTSTSTTSTSTTTTTTTTAAPQCSYDGLTIVCNSETTTTTTTEAPNIFTVSLSTSPGGVCARSVIRTVRASNDSPNLGAAVGAALYRMPQNVLITGYTYVAEDDGFTTTSSIYEISTFTGVVGSDTLSGC